MKPIRTPAVLALLAWMAMVIFVYLLVTVPFQGRPGTLLYQILRLRDVVYPLFYSPSIMY